MDPAAARTHLEDRLRTLIGRRSAIGSHLRGQDGRLEAHAADLGAILEGDEVLEGLEDAVRSELVEIRDALRRIADGTYGTCARCGDPIAPGRLAALPHARRCVRCA